MLKFIHRLLNGESPTINGDARQTRGFTYVENVVAANLAVCTVPSAAGQLFSVAGGQPHSVVDMLAELGHIIGCEVKPVFGPVRLGDVPNSHADSARARQLLGYQPKLQFEEGLKRTVDAMKVRLGPRT